MAKMIEYDNTEVEPSQGGGEEPPLGIQDAEVMICVARDVKRDGSPANDLEVAFKINDDDSIRWLYEYVGLGAGSEWKMREFTDALGLPAKGKLDPDKMVGKKLKVNIKQGSYNGEARAEIGRMLNAGDAAEADDAPDDAPGADPDFVPSVEGEGDVASYDEWDAADVKGEFEDRQLTISGRKTTAAMIKALREDDASQNGSGEDDYDTWDLESLAGEVKDRGITLPRGKKTEDQLIAALREHDAEPF